MNGILPKRKWRRGSAGEVQSRSTCLRLHFFLCALCASAFLSGCSMVSGTRHADGRLVVTSWRFLWKSEAVRFTARDTNFVAVLSIGKSATDAESVNAVTEAVVTGLVKGFVP